MSERIYTQFFALKVNICSGAIKKETPHFVFHYKHQNCWLELPQQSIMQLVQRHKTFPKEDNSSLSSQLVPQSFPCFFSPSFPASLLSSLIYSFSSFSKGFFNLCCEPGIILSAGDIIRNKK